MRTQNYTMSGVHDEGVSHRPVHFVGDVQMRHELRRDAPGLPHALADLQERLRGGDGGDVEFDVVDAVVVVGGANSNNTKELARLARERVTVLHLTAAVFAQVAREAPAVLGGPRLVLFGGEASGPAAGARALAEGRPRKLLHMYGPTETTTFATWHRVEVVPGGETVPIGRPLANTTLYVLDRHLAPVPPGSVGELCIGGDGLARGYLGRPELTAQRFVPDPWGEGGRLYRSGDLARHLPDGALDCLGRIDHQLKIRGFRIEPGEIEAVLGEHPEVRAAAVGARPSPGGGLRLVAWVAGGEAEALHRHLAERLPPHLVPSAFVILPELPLTPNGKVDRKALPDPGGPGGAPAAPASPRAAAPLVELLAGIWAEVLEHEELPGPQDNFFALGGHSLLATRVVSRLRAALGPERVSFTGTAPVFDDEGRVVRFVGIQDDVTEQRLAEEALQVLAEASEMLAVSLDYRERLSGLARLAVPRLADWCAVDILEEDGSVSRLAVEHQDPEKVALAYELERRYPSDPAAPFGVPNVLRTGEPEIVPEIPDAFLRENARDAEQLAMIRELGLRSYMVLPMVARGRTLGAMTLVWAESGWRYGERDLATAGTLVRRAAVAVDNARLFEEATREVAERERAEASLRESEDRLRLATEATQLGTFDFKPQTGELLWDARCKEIFGLPPTAEVDYGTFLAGLHPDDRARADGVVRRTLDPAGDGEYEIEYRVVGLEDGVERWVEARGRAFFEDGRAGRFIGTVLDVTEKKRAEEALKRSEERYRAVIEQSTEGIYLLDADSRRLLETNPAFQRMFGYTAEELRGMELYDLVAHSRDDVDTNIGRTLEAGRRLLGERRYRRKDGVLLEVEVGVSTISYNSHHAICAVVRDVTARKRAEEALKRSEERFRSLVRYASDIIIILDGDGEILYESPVVERVLGFTPEERMGTNAFDYLHPEDRGPVGERFARLVTEPGGRVSAEYRTRNKEGDWRTFEAVGVNLLDDPVIRGIVVNSRDVTERRRTEQALAEIRESERGRIARELHDGVLQDLSYTAQAMEVTRVKYGGTGVEADLEEGAEAIRRAARDLREAIYDLRAYKHGTQDARELFESMIALTRRRMPGIEIESRLDEDVLVTISARSALELLRIAQEALTNVRRHSGAHVARVVLDAPGSSVRLEISDDGRGFDPELLPSGIGTVGMRERALGLGGNLSVESEPGSGTTVRFEAPLENFRRQ